MRLASLIVFLLACDPPAEDSKDPGASDADADGWTVADGDCDDAAERVHPGATETCDGVDEDCDGTVDDAALTWFIDEDEDGYGDATTATTGCPTGYVADGSDCNDLDPDVHPGVEETCDGVDSDCDGAIDDDAVATTLYQDRDGDGYGNAAVTTEQCLLGDGWAANDADCNDNDATVSPEGMETCDGADEDCDGAVDETGADGESTWYQDTDGDGFGDEATGTLACDPGVGWVGAAGDCDDHAAAINPEAEETCNTADDDCDGEIDESGGLGTWYPDADGDGYGSEDGAVTGCTAIDGYVYVAGDCDDSSAAISPDAKDYAYDGVDSNCSGDSDFDADADGYDASAYGGTDCDDNTTVVHPGAADTPYDGVDSDCSGGSDYDADGDGHDSTAWGGDDCDDTRPDVYPGAYDVDDSIDYNCDGRRNTMPTASAELVTVDPRTCLDVKLDGSGSSDPEGASLTYSWELVSAPAGSALTTADLADPSSETLSFTPDEDGVYVLSLVVYDDLGAPSYPSTVEVEVGARTSNVAPVADSGADQSTRYTQACTPVSYGTEYSCPPCPWVGFTVDGSGSYDADGEALAYNWSVRSGPGSFIGATDGAVVLVRHEGATPTYGGSTTETVTVRLSVTDCYGATSAFSDIDLLYTCSGG